jgi:penicillin-binding protein 2
MKLISLSWLGYTLVSLFILGQLFKLQIIQGEDQSRRSEQNRLRIRTIVAPRGIFYDVNGKALIEIKGDLRVYLYPKEFSHVVGYTGQADPQELITFGVDLGAKIGKLGLERRENGLLAGTVGGVVEEYAASGSKLRTLSETKPVPGRSIQLNLDLELQKKAYKLLEESGYLGSVIVSTAHGKLLALVNYPSLDVNIFEDPDRASEIGKIFSDETMPFFDRAIAGQYPPASTFKIVTSLAALEEGVIDERFTIDDKGFIKVGDFRYGNWYFDQYGRTEGTVDLIKALQRSNDIYFYKIGEMLGIEKLAYWARILGLGEVSGIRIEGEKKGLVPDPEWKESNRNEPWYLGDTYITAIGQGNLQMTPLQVHQMTSIVAGDGEVCQPSLVAAVVDADPPPFDILGDTKGVNCRQLPIAKKNLDLVREGMSAACEPGGTGWPLFNFVVNNESLPVDGERFLQAASASASYRQVPVACKTGTAETGRSIYEEGKEKFLTHAWFVAFAPVVEPEVVVTVMLEDAGQGSDMAAPIARELLREWFARER